MKSLVDTGFLGNGVFLGRALEGFQGQLEGGLGMGWRQERKETGRVRRWSGVPRSLVYMAFEPYSGRGQGWFAYTGS